MQHYEDVNTLIVLLNWNGGGLTKDCCKSLLNLDTQNQDIFVVDNFSERKDFDSLEKFFSESCTSFNKIEENSALDELFNSYNIDYVIQYNFVNGIKIYLARSLTNHGFSKGCNFGALVADALNYPRLLLLNNDTIAESDFLNVLNNQFDNYDIVIPQIRFFEPKDIIWNCGGEISPFGKRTYLYANKPASTVDLSYDSIPISFATGCCMLIATDYYIQVGMFTEDFFFGEEDIDFALRLKKLKAKIACVPRSVIYHKVGASLAGDLTKTRRKAFIHYLNRAINMKKHLGLIWYLWVFPATCKMLINLHRLYKMTLRESLSFTFKVLSSSLIKDKVEKEYFENIIKNGY